MTYLIDTNVLVYAIDARDSSQQIRAHDVLARLVERNDVAVPSQTLAEFTNVCLRKLGAKPEWVHTQVERFDPASLD